MSASKDDSAVDDPAARLDRLLEHVTYDASAHIGVTFLPRPQEQAMQLTAAIGVPRGLARSWSRVALAVPSPVAEAVRTRSPVWLPDQQALANRFPRFALAFPYAVAHYAVPLMADGICWGVLYLVWPGSRPELSVAERARISEGAGRMVGVLQDAAGQGRPVRPRDELLILESSAANRGGSDASLGERFTDGFMVLDLQGRMISLTDRAAQLLGHERAELLDTEPWDGLPWLSDPAFEHAFVAAALSRQPGRFAACRPDGTWLSFLLYPDVTGISVRIMPGKAPETDLNVAEDTMPGAPARAGALFHLLHLASALTEARGVSELAESLMRQMRPALSAQGLALVVAEEGRLRVAGSRGFPEGMRPHFDGMPLATQSEGVRTIETGVPGFHPTTADLVRAFPHHRHYQHMGAFAFLPMTASGGTFGCLVLGYDQPRPFTTDERAELTSLAGMIAQALERARLYDATVQVARGLQDGLLPHRLPRIPGLEVAARYRPATHALDVGGDFYDLIDFGAQGAAAVIGDVQGHSVQAAALMGQIRTAIHSYARTGAPPEEVLARTNTLLMELDSDLFCSCLYAHIDVRGHRVLLAGAGHPPPILRHRAHHAEVLDIPAGLLLGVQEEAHFQTVEMPLPPGKLLALYTDGLVERPGTDLGSSIDRLAGELAEAGDEPLDVLADAVITSAQETADPAKSDDTALLLVRCDTGASIARATA